MRLIDADVFKKDLENQMELLFDTEIVELIDNQPTVDQWIPTSERLPKHTEFDYFKELFNKAIECIEMCEHTCINCVYFDDEYRECGHWGGTIWTDPERSSCKYWEIL